MNILTTENISKNYSEKPLLNNINLGIEDQDKIGVIGINGTGKSTLLKLIAGLEEVDEGRIIKGNSVRIEYLAQNPFLDPDASVSDFAKDYESKTALTKLGIMDFDVKVGSLSGGQRKRIALAKALVNPSELLILDEPTNHLDNESIDWLEQYLNRRKGALIMITHDRYFLNRVVNQIIEIDKGSLYTYKGNYSYFLEKKLEREELQAANEKNRRSLYKKELAWIRKGAKARTTKQKARIDRFELLGDSAIDINEDKLDISISGSRLGKKIIELQHICKSFGDVKIIDDYNYIVLRNDRVGIIGQNGSGKSTLINIINGSLKQDGGVVDVGDTVKIGLFSQETNHMDGSLRVIDYIKEASVINASMMLERFLFPPETQWTPISKLSGGEKRRLYLLRVLIEAPNVLLLDEPTNDLDIETLTVLEDYLEEFNGAVIAVSHDRYFLDRMAEKIFVFDGEGKISKHTGNYFDYRENLEAKTDKKVIAKSDAEPDYRQKPKDKSLKFSYKEQREFESIDDDIAELENKIQQLDHKVNKASADYDALKPLLLEKEEAEKQLESKMERWIYLNELAQKIEEAKL